MNESDDSVCALEEYRDQVTGLKGELDEINTTLLSSDVAADDPVMQAKAQVDKLVFECLLTIKKCLCSSTVTHVATSSETSATKLPKLEVPAFHGDILNGKTFGNNFVFLFMTVQISPRQRSWYICKTRSRIRLPKVSLKVSQSPVSTMMKPLSVSYPDMIARASFIGHMFVV